MGSDSSEEKIMKKAKFRDNRTLVALILGLVCGFFLEYFFTIINTYVISQKLCTLQDLHPYKTKLGQKEIPKYDNKDDLGHFKREDFIYRVDDVVAEKYKEKMKILCYVITSVKYHKTRAQHVKNTWGKRCDYLVFFSDVHNGELPAVALPDTKDSFRYWNRSLYALDYLYSKYFYKADWFLKADDTNYVIIENLR